MSPEPILLVEDDENDIFFFEKAAKKAGIVNTIIVLRDGHQALDYFQGRGNYSDRALYKLPRLVFLDIKLPETSGLEVLHWLRSKASLNSLVIIMLTSSNAQKDIQQAYASGANSYLIKPGNPEKLVQMLASVKQYWLGHNVNPAILATLSKPLAIPPQKE